jgi:hypothetical protein
MSALGQMPTLRDDQRMSASPSSADMERREQRVAAAARRAKRQNRAACFARRVKRAAQKYSSFRKAEFMI